MTLSRNRGDCWLFQIQLLIVEFFCVEFFWGVWHPGFIVYVRVHLFYVSPNYTWLQGCRRYARACDSIGSSLSQGDYPAQSAFFRDNRKQRVGTSLLCEVFFSWYTFQLREESDYPFGLFSLFSNSIILEAFLTPLKHFELWPLTPIPPSFRVGIPRGGSCPKQV